MKTTPKTLAKLSADPNQTAAQQLENMSRLYQAKCDEARKLRAIIDTFVKGYNKIRTPRERAALKRKP